MHIYLDIIEQFTCEMCGSCCRNDWLITVDKNSYLRNADLFGATGRTAEFSKAFIRLPEDNSGEYAYIAKQPSGGCWFLDSENFCRLHREAGHSHLDNVCQTFPRYPMNTARGIELTLSFSCPAVIKLASRIAPLNVIRSESQPMEINPDNYVVEVFPKQQAMYNPLYFYFELEHHFIDILQCRALTIEERLRLLEDTAQAVSGLSRDEEVGQQLNELIYHNYDLLDSKVAAAQSLNDFASPSDILLENFFVNFVFKKPFYVYGLKRAIGLLNTIWGSIVNARKDMVDQADDLQRVREIIMNVELQYGHNRKALFK